jgi:hypothetical protein
VIQETVIVIDEYLRFEEIISNFDTKESYTHHFKYLSFVQSLQTIDYFKCSYACHSIDVLCAFFSFSLKERLTQTQSLLLSDLN